MANSLNIRRRRFFETNKESVHRKARKADDAKRRDREAKTLRANLRRVAGPIRLAG